MGDEDDPGFDKLLFWKSRWSWGAENHIGASVVAAAVGASVCFSFARFWRKRKQTIAKTPTGDDNDEWKSWSTVVQALIGLYGSVLYWVGMWNLCVHNLYDESGEVTEDEDVWVADIAGFFFGGLALGLITDSVYAMGCIDPRTCLGSDGYFPEVWSKRRGVMSLRVLGGLLATIFIWIGVFFFISHFVYIDSEDLYNFAGYVQTPMPTSSLPHPRSGCMAAAETAGCTRPDGEAVFSAECSQCVVDNWAVIEADPSCLPADDDFYLPPDEGGFYRDSAIFDTLVVYCREQEVLPHAPAKYLIKDWIVFWVGVLLLHVSGTFYEVGMMTVKGPARTWFMCSTAPKAGGGAGGGMGGGTGGGIGGMGPRSVVQSLSVQSLSVGTINSSSTTATKVADAAGFDDNNDNNKQEPLLGGAGAGASGVAAAGTPAVGTAASGTGAAEVGTGAAGAESSAGLSEYCEHLIRAVVSLVGQAAMWQAWWDIIEFYQVSTVWREIAFVLVGLLAFCATQTFFDQSGITLDAQMLDTALTFRDNTARGGRSASERSATEEMPGLPPVLNISTPGNGNRADLSGGMEGDKHTAPPFSILLWLKTMLSILAQLTHLVGCWTLLDDYVGEADFMNHSKNFLYVVGGLIMLAISGTLNMNAGISETNNEYVLQPARMMSRVQGSVVAVQRDIAVRSVHSMMHTLSMSMATSMAMDLGSRPEEANQPTSEMTLESASAVVDL